MIIQKKRGKSAILTVFSLFLRFFTIFARSEWRQNGKMGNLTTKPQGEKLSAFGGQPEYLFTTKAPGHKENFKAQSRRKTPKYFNREGTLIDAKKEIF